MYPAYKFFTKQSEWKAYLQYLVSNSDRACIGAIICIDNYQTYPERQLCQSTEENGVGWTKHDANEMGIIAKKIRNGQNLTAGELAKSKNKMKKYWKQLMVISKQKLANMEAQEKENAIQAEQFIEEEKKRQFQNALEKVKKCGEEGIQCEYGICSECPLTNGYQLRLPIS